MTNHADETRFPAVDRLRDELGAELLHAARANQGARFRFSRRRGAVVLAIVSVAAAPAALAGAGVFDSSADVEYECAEAEKLHENSEVLPGAPVEGPGAPGSVVEEEPAQSPDNPCD
jgi:ferric-dicitrate binding protein FerR (iron transport regulator)